MVLEEEIREFLKVVAVIKKNNHEIEWGWDQGV